MTRILITGTGTDVGKTLVAKVLVVGMRALGRQIYYWKPVQTGAGPDDGDAASMGAIAQDAVVKQGCRYFPLPASPDQAARAARQKPPRIADILAAAPQAEMVLMEGAGGLLVPLNDEGETWADVPYPVIVVASTQLGTLNHTSLTIEALQRRGRQILAVVLSGSEHPANLASLQRRYPTLYFHWLPPQDVQQPEDPGLCQIILERLALAIDPKLCAVRSSGVANWLEADRRHVWHPYTQHKTAPVPLPIAAAAGAHVYLADGTRLIDGTSSWWVNTIGHGQPEIAAAIAAQQQTLDHVLFAGATHEPGARLAAELVRLAGAGLSRVFYSDNGSTAVEVAMKIAYQSWVNRGEPERTSFLAFRGSYHGDTFGTMAIGASAGFHGVFKPFLFPVEHALPVTSHRSTVCPDGIGALTQRLQELERIMSGRRFAGAVIEPLVQGAGGMLMQPVEFLQGVAELCQRYEIPLILDEVMTGFGRTGAWFAFQRAGITPDLICVAKGLTGGNLPLAVTLARESYFEAFASDDRAKALLHGHSYTANPIACAAALASLAITEGERLPDRALAMESRYREFIEVEAKRLRLQEARCVGGVFACELPDSGAGNYFDPRAGQIAALAREAGLLIRPLGNTVYLLPPLVIDDVTLTEALEALARTLVQMERV